MAILLRDELCRKMVVMLYMLIFVVLVFSIGIILYALPLILYVAPIIAFGTLVSLAKEFARDRDNSNGLKRDY